MKYVCIYKITNPKGKIYIGQTVDVARRFDCYKQLKCKNQLKIYNSLKKYGVKNHKFEVLYHNLSRLKANKIECYFIKIYKKKNKALNLQDGGTNNSFCFNNKRSKKIIQLSLHKSIVKIWDSSLQISKELGYHRNAIRNACKNEYKNNYSNGFLWMYLDDYNKNKDIKLGVKYKPVIQFDLEGNFIKEWQSQSEAAKELNISISSIHSACFKTYGSNYGGGYLWISKIAYLNKESPIKPKAKPKLYQYDINWNFIREWENMKVAASYYNITRATISGVVNGRGYTAAGYRWTNKII